MERLATVRVILCEILRLGLLQIRGLASSSSPDCTARIADAADHLHNLPALIADEDPGGLLIYYWEVERPAFQQSLLEGELAAFEPLWNRLGPLLEEHHAASDDDAVLKILGLLESSRADLG